MHTRAFAVAGSCSRLEAWWWTSLLTPRPPTQAQHRYPCCRSSPTRQSARILHTQRAHARYHRGRARAIRAVVVRSGRSVAIPQHVVLVCAAAHTRLLCARPSAQSTEHEASPGTTHGIVRYRTRPATTRFAHRALCASPTPLRARTRLSHHHIFPAPPSACARRTALGSSSSFKAPAVPPAAPPTCLRLEVLTARPTQDRTPSPPSPLTVGSAARTSSSSSLSTWTS